MQSYKVLSHIFAFFIEITPLLSQRAQKAFENMPWRHNGTYLEVELSSEEDLARGSISDLQFLRLDGEGHGVAIGIVTL